MSYKLKSLLYFLAFVASSIIYYSMYEVKTENIKVVSSAKMDSAHTAANDAMMDDEAMLLK